VARGGNALLLPKEEDRPALLMGHEWAAWLGQTGRKQLVAAEIKEKGVGPNKEAGPK
jgi:hypothetical protein